MGGLFPAFSFIGGKMKKDQASEAIMGGRAAFMKNRT